MAECRFCGCRLDTDPDTGEHLDNFNCIIALKAERDRLRAEVARLSESEQQLQAENERLCREALRRLWRSDDVRRAIDATPAFPGDMTDSVWEKLNGNRAATQDALRWAVIETKKEILRRLNALNAAREEE